MPGFIADRLLEALWREALHLVNDGVSTTSEIDDAILYGAGIRWSFMDTFLTYTLAGVEAGMRHFMQQFGPALELPWTKLVVPTLTDELIDRVVDGTSRQTNGRGIKELERYRDDCIASVIEAIVQTKARVTVSKTERVGATMTSTIYRDTVKPEWVDYNGHLRDAFYMLIYSLSTDALMDRIELDEAGRSVRHHALHAGGACELSARDQGRRGGAGGCMGDRRRSQTHSSVSGDVRGR